ASPGCFFQIDPHRDHAPIEARGGFTRLPRDAFSCPLFNRLRNSGFIEHRGIISILVSYSVEAISCVADSMRILVNQRTMRGVATTVKPPRYTKARASEKEKAHALH